MTMSQLQERDDPIGYTYSKNVEARRKAMERDEWDKKCYQKRCIEEIKLDEGKS